MVSKVFLPEDGDMNTLGAGGKGVVEDAIEIEGGCQGGGRDGLGPGRAGGDVEGRVWTHEQPGLVVAGG